MAVPRHGSSFDRIQASLVNIETCVNARNHVPCVQLWSTPERSGARTHDRPRHPRRSPVRVSARLRLRNVERELPDRGRGPRGRARSVDLGHVQPHTGEGAERRHRRRRLRSLPPLARGPGSDARPGPERLPFQRRVAARPARGKGTGQPGGPGFLRAAGGRAPRARDGAPPDPVPLGSPAGPPRPGRVAAARHGRRLRRLRPRRGRAARRSGGHVGHPQRALLRRLPRPPVRQARARGLGLGRLAGGEPPHPALARPGGAGRARLPSPRPGRPGQQPRPHPPGQRSPRGPGRRSPHRRAPQPLVPRSGVREGLSARGAGARPLAAVRRAPCCPGTWTRSRSPSISWA